MTEREAIAQLNRYAEQFPESLIHYSYGPEWRVAVIERYAYSDGTSGCIEFSDPENTEAHGAFVKLSSPDAELIEKEIWYFMPYKTPIDPISWNDKKYANNLLTFLRSFIHSGINNRR